MIWSRLYLLYGIALVSTLGVGVYRGWSFTNVDQVRNVPISVRDNPGSYRSIYNSYHHYTGGK
jgi:hypothetical protein